MDDPVGIEEEDRLRHVARAKDLDQARGALVGVRKAPRPRGTSSKLSAMRLAAWGGVDAITLIVRLPGTTIASAMQAIIALSTKRNPVIALPPGSSRLRQ